MKKFMLITGRHFIEIVKMSHLTFDSNTVISICRHGIVHKQNRSYTVIIFYLNFNSIAQIVYFVQVMYVVCYCRLMRTLSKVETRGNSSGQIALSCFQCVAYVLECNAVKMT